MLVRSLTIPAAFAVILLAGCAASPATFYADSAGLSDTRLCRTLKTASSGSDPGFAADVRRAVEARGFNDFSCQSLVDKQNAAIAVGVVAGAALVAVARNGGGAGVGVGVGASTTIVQGHDVDWDWDQFNQQGQLVWACRGVQTGQYSETYHCNGKIQADWRWPQN